MRSKRLKTRRKLLILLGVGMLVAPLRPLAQTKGKVWRIGFLGASPAAGYETRIEALRAGLREFGYVEGRNLTVDFRWADGKYERLPALAAELVRAKVDLIVTYGTPGTLACTQATSTIPIVMAIAGDAVATSIVASPARPGGNVTGSTFFNSELAAKRLELIRETFPRARRVAALFNPANPGAGPVLQAMQPAAQSLKLELQRFEVRAPGDLERAFSAMVADRIDAVVAIEDAMLNANVGQLASLAAGKKLPLIGAPDFADFGALMAYGVAQAPVYRRAAHFVDRIFKGAKPGDLPIERATKFEVILNQKAATALGVKFPQSILVRAERVIE
jgi:putative ABC transport system substrate-binding protein